jgi:peptidoglycan hydrolase-like protein with peptidoglycan-binding domain
VGALGGAAIGGGVGAVAGATTTPDQVNLGRPVWNDPEVRVPGINNRSGGGSSTVASSGQTRNIQQALSQRGYDVGPVDGIYGPQTRRAISQFQRDNNMDVTGRPNAQVANALNVETGTAQARGSSTDRSNMNTGSNSGSNATSGSGMGGPGNTNLGRENHISGTGRPNPTAPRAGASPSNNPVNDPVGGAGQGNTPGLNQNR